MSYISSGTPASPPIVANGLISGLNTQAIIQAELAPWQQPITNLQNEQTTLNNNVSDYQTINSDLAAMKSAADQLASSSGWQARSATVSDSTVATATATSGTPTGSLQFSVLQLAAANSLVSSGTVSSTSQIVTSNSDFLISQGGATLGFSSLGSGSSLNLGSHTIDVTQSSAAATSTGTTNLASASSGITVTTGSNDTVSLTVGSGTSAKSYSLVIPPSSSGGYSGAGLLTAVQSAISSAGASGVIQAGYNSSGDLVLGTTAQGSSQTLTVNSSDGLGTLGLSAGASTGTDAVVTVDGVQNTLSNLAAGAAVTLNGASGSTINAVLGSTPAVGSSLVSDGSMTATNVSTGSGSLADVVSNINAAGAGVTASAVQTGTNQYVLQLASSSTGQSNDLSVDSSAFSGSSLGTFNTASAGQDAKIQVGGAGGYTVSSNSDTFTGLLPGLSVTAQKVSSTPVTVSVANDTASITKSVKTLVDDANTVLADLQKYAGYNAATKTGGPLMGSGVLQNVLNSVLSAFASTGGTSNLANPSAAGITISNGQISFDQNAFSAAFDKNPTQVENLFTRGGTMAPSSPYAGLVTFTYASNTTQSGSYAVNLTQSASQAIASGTAQTGGTVGTSDNLTISSGGATATVAAASGQSMSTLAQNLNAAFASQGMGLSAVVASTGNSIQLISTDYGSSANFSVTESATGSPLGLAGTYTGKDVQGTINGVAAIGSGQFLTAPSSDPTLGGLSLQIATSNVTGSLGNFSYSPGLAQVLSNIGSAASDPLHGTVTQTIKGLQQESTGLTPQIQFYTSMMNQQQTMLKQEYATMEATLGSLKNQSAALGAQLSKISSSGG